MRSLNLSQATFETQTQAVKEERRMRVDNQPYARFIQDAIFAQLQDSTSCFGYAHTTIGDMADLDSARLTDVQAFFDQYYKPGNAVLTVVGDFDETEARGLIEQYFAGIPAGSAVPAVDCRPRYNVGPRHSDVTDPNATLPMVLMVYNGPPANAADAPALDLLTTILGDGQSSRFNQRLVRQEQAALQVQSGWLGMRMAGALINLALANQGQSPARIETLLNEEVERVRTDTVTTEELSKARNLYRAEAIRSRQTTMGVAETLQGALWMNGDLEAANTDWQAYQRVTVADLHRVARQYFAPENRLTLIINPPARGAN
jgi:predicted Zn-dependent peptidase